MLDAMYYAAYFAHHSYLALSPTLFREAVDDRACHEEFAS